MKSVTVPRGILRVRRTAECYPVKRSGQAVNRDSGFMFRTKHQRHRCETSQFVFLKLKSKFFSTNPPIRKGVNIYLFSYSHSQGDTNSSVNSMIKMLY